MAVGVQTLVRARVAGVAFSAHPLDADRDCIVVEAVLGLGVPAVSGAVRPEHIELTRARQISRRSPARQERLHVADARGVREEPVRCQVGATEGAVLDDVELDSVVDMVLAVETVVGFPVDVEWAVASAPGEPVVVSLLQARPIAPAPNRRPGWPSGQRSAFRSAERFVPARAKWS